MYVYKTEILKVNPKFLTDKATEKDTLKLDELINKRASEGWELTTYNYMATSMQIAGAFIITFRKEA